MDTETVNLSLPTARATNNMGGGTYHLSEPAKALIIERILAGDTNREINVALQKAKHIAPNTQISKTTQVSQLRRSARSGATVVDRGDSGWAQRALGSDPDARKYPRADI